MGKRAREPDAEADTAKDDATVAEEVLAIEAVLLRSIAQLEFRSPTTHVYNPLEYAAAPHSEYTRRYGGRRGVVLIIGMNPGPWGMAQTGVPFGEIKAVREWMGIVNTTVGKPVKENPARPITGFECSRSEVSGRRLWGWAASKYPVADHFFDKAFVWNYVPLAFMETGGKNRTPDALPSYERLPLLTACDAALLSLINLIKPRHVVGVGKWAAERALAVCTTIPISTRPPVTGILHPSPASPAANNGWEAKIEKQLGDAAIEFPSPESESMSCTVQDQDQAPVKQARPAGSGLSTGGA